MSFPTKIGFHAPYTWDEATYLACSLSDFLTRSGISVSYLSNQSHEQNVHYRWDNLVTNGKRHDFYSWRQDCSHLVWFDVQRDKVTAARREGRRNILVPLWHRLLPQDLDTMSQYDFVVCTHPALYKQLKRSVKTNVLLIPWHTCLRLPDQTMSFGGKRFFCPLDSYTTRKIGGLLLSTLQVMLDFDEDVTFTLSYNRSWSREQTAMLGDLIRKDPRRLQIIKRPTYSDRLEAYGRHDWTFIPALRANVGLYALEALAYRRPVLAFDAPPHSSLLKNNINSCLVPCELSKTWLGASEVVVNSFDLVEQFRRVVEDPGIYEQLRKHASEDYAASELKFTSEWQRILEIS